MLSAEEKKLKILEKKREMFFSKMQNMYDLALKVNKNEARMKEFIMRARTLDFVKVQFLSIIDDINEIKLELNHTFEPNYREIEAFDEMYYVVYDLFQTEETKVTLRNVNMSANPIFNQTPKLQRIQLPTFDGNPDEWPLFYQLFNKLVNENHALTDIEKVTHLVTHLAGTAKSVCTSVSPTAENYALILQTLKDRFEDKRALTSNCIERILNFKPLQNESDKGLDSFLASFVEPVNALKKMKISDLADYVFLHIGLKKLDPTTARLFEHSVRSDTDLPQFQTLVTFVTEQSKILSRSHSPKAPTSKFSGANQKGSQALLAHNSDGYPSSPSPSSEGNDSNDSKTVSQTCPLCSTESHLLFSCPAFKKMKVDDRWKLVEGKRCYNCLSPIHFSNSCKSTQSCRVQGCSKRHHSLLHRVSPPSNPSESPASSIQKGSDTTKDLTATQSYCATSGAVSNQPSTVLLATVIVLAKDSQGRTHEIRGILDAGSQSNFLTQRACRRLGLHQQSIHSVVKGIGSSPLNVSACATLNFHSRVDPTQHYVAHALVVNRLSDCVPTTPILRSHLSHLKDLPLSDAEFHKPHEIDLLIGAELWPLIVGTRKVVGPPNLPVALETTLGYVVMGRAVIDTHHHQMNSLCVFNHAFHSTCLLVQPTLNDMIRKFWELEEVPKRHLQSIEDTKCERFFMETYVREVDGTFTVRLPFRKSPELLGSSKESCVSQLIALERRLQRDTKLRDMYSGLIKEYLDDGTVSRVGTIGTTNNELAYYMPHHGVYRPDHPTTPLRIVFNASAPTSTSLSLNNLLYVGPKLQADIFNVLIHFRLFRFVATSDAKRMFLRISIAQEDRRFQRFVWRPAPDQPIDVYEINKVVFGNTSSPYLANKVVRVLASLEKSNFPLASALVERDVYVDDIATSVDTEDELMEVYHQLTALFASGGFSLSKWVSNSERLMEAIPKESRLPMINFDHDSTSKILGVRWATQKDAFACVVDPVDLPCTKRQVSSIIAHIFDPLGLVAPVTLKAKLFLKLLWAKELDWDAKPPQAIIDDWNNFRTALPLLKDVSFPRHSGIVVGAQTALVGFSDSSENAYGACLYVRSVIPGEKPMVRLLCAKAKVAPAKVVTIPRLELCAALLLSQLMKFIIETYEPRHTFDSIVAFTDSRVTLHWIHSDPARWKIFVGNRLSQLQDNLPPCHWRHVPGEQNPADVLSRGISPEGFLRHPLWHSGPAWMLEEESSWPAAPVDSSLSFAKDEEKPVKLAFHTISPQDNPLLPLLDRISSFRKLLRATAYIYRVMTAKMLRGAWVTREELQRALDTWIKLVQSQHYSKEIAKLEKGQPIHSNIRHLSPFLHEGIVRVGGRLDNAPLSFDQKHPILLPTHGRFVDLLIDQYHIDLLHAGQHLLLSQFRLAYWLPSARTRIRSRIHSCNTCFRAKPKPTIPKMAALPGFRVEGTRVFQRTGVDYAGPFSITPHRRRGQRALTKAYICVFVCLAVKAVHIELASDLSADCFLAAYKRFLGRRGPCALLLSDGGTNFIGARRKLGELEKLFASTSFQAQVGRELAHKGVEWKINPAYGPWFGGIWEANIKCIKNHFQRVVGEQILTYEELNTVIVQVEAVLNSRPLCVLNNDPSSPTALTPAHFLNPGANLDQLPAQNLRNVALNRLTRFELIDRLVQDYWERWRIEYLQTLQSRAKWIKESTPIKLGSVVVIMQDNVPPLRWPLGLVEEVHPGSDGNVRVVSVRTRSGVYRRPVGRVCPLPTQ